MTNILITGASGFVGQALVQELKNNGSSINNLHTFRSSEYDLRDANAVSQLFSDKPCDTVIHLAATVGGIGANMRHPGKFFYDNMIMGCNLIEQARRSGTKKVVLLGTICAYPKFTPVPFKEEDLWQGYPEETNAPYGIAKKALMVQLAAYKQEYGLNGITLLPVNLYGPRDNFDLESSHVIPAMIRKFHQAKINRDPVVTLWGDGSPSREFLYVDDAARAIRLAMELYDDAEPVNLGSGKEINMRLLADMVKNVVGYEGSIIWDSTKPNGQPRRCLDVNRARERFGFTSNITLPMGLELTYKWFKAMLEENANNSILDKRDQPTRESSHS
jgi:GDP-L-fucose synthase